MSFLVANTTGSPPIWVKGNFCSLLLSMGFSLLCAIYSSNLRLHLLKLQCIFFQLN